MKERTQCEMRRCCGKCIKLVCLYIGMLWCCCWSLLLFRWNEIPLPLCCSRRYTRFMLWKSIKMKHPIPVLFLWSWWRGCDVLTLLAFVVEADGWTRGLRTCAYTKVIICVWYMENHGEEKLHNGIFYLQFFP